LIPDCKLNRQRLFQNFSFGTASIFITKNLPGGIMRRLVFILIAFIAAITFIRALDSGSSSAVTGTDIPGVVINGGR
jgi:hypothetical protein